MAVPALRYMYFTVNQYLAWQAHLAQSAISGTVSMPAVAAPIKHQGVLSEGV